MFLRVTSEDPPRQKNIKCKVISSLPNISWYQRLLVTFHDGIAITPPTINLSNSTRIAVYNFFIWSFSRIRLNKEDESWWEGSRQICNYGEGHSKESHGSKSYGLRSILQDLQSRLAISGISVSTIDWPRKPRLLWKSVLFFGLQDKSNF